jgi:hypothetical protein
MQVIRNRRAPIRSTAASATMTITVPIKETRRNMA